MLFVSIDIGRFVVRPDATVTAIPQEFGDACEILIAVAVKLLLASLARKLETEFTDSEGVERITTENRGTNTSIAVALVAYPVAMRSKLAVPPQY